MIDRRRLLATLAAAAPSMMGLGTVGRALAQQARDAQLIAANVCQITPQTTEGPFYFDPRLSRADIREGRPGHPLWLDLQVVDAVCRPVPGARVDVWHCDAQGNYSGYAGQTTGDMRGDTFLRGAQIADAQGRVAFRTIWPGWYRGRTTHVHVKVLMGERDLMTGQIFFPDRFSQAVYAQVPAYARPSTDGLIANARDGIARAAGAGAYAEVLSDGAGFRAAMVIGVA